MRRGTGATSGLSASSCKERNFEARGALCA